MDAITVTKVPTTNQARPIAPMARNFPTGRPPSPPLKNPLKWMVEPFGTVQISPIYNSKHPSHPGPPIPPSTTSTVSPRNLRSTPKPPNRQQIYTIEIPENVVEPVWGLPEIQARMRKDVERWARKKQERICRGTLSETLPLRCNTRWAKLSVTDRSSICLQLPSFQLSASCNGCLPVVRQGTF